MDVAANTRFQRYRGLRSFRTSPWDPYENLPRDYARIFQFEDYKRTERAVRRRMEEEGYGIEVFFLFLNSTLLLMLIPWPARYSGNSLSQGCSPRGSSGPNIPFHYLQLASTRTQKIRTQLHRSTEYRVWWFHTIKGNVNHLWLL